MRYYTHEELKELAYIYNNYWLANTELSEHEKLSYPKISKIDLNVFLDTNLNKLQPMKFKDFLGLYPLNVRDYFEDEHVIIEDTIKNISLEEKRYPIIVLFTETTGEPDMFILSEYNTVIRNFDVDDFEVLVLNKMTYPIDKELLKKMSEYYKLNYNPAVYDV